MTGSSRGLTPNGVFNRVGRTLAATSVCCIVSACGLTNLVDGAKAPSDILDPQAVQNEAGALAMYYGALDALAHAVGGGNELLEQSNPTPTSLPPAFIVVTGTLTDEFEMRPGLVFGEVSGLLAPVDLRYFDPSLPMSDYGYSSLHLIRGRSREARGYIRKYGPRLPMELLSHLYAIEALSEVMLAELYCSGIPLGTIDFDADVTTTAGFTTDEVYDHALALFDSATALVGDSLRFAYLIRLGKARALLGKGDVAAAASVAADVPQSYRYVITYASDRPKFIPVSTLINVSDQEGINGLPFVTSADPRTSRPEFMNRTAPLVFATGLEQNLLRAEAAGFGDDLAWLDELNRLRTTCIRGETCTSPAPAGIGGIANLPPLEDPAHGKLTREDSVNARVDLLFSERAFWLYLTGRRQGDLRRLVRHYQRSESTVYPTGLWGAVGANQYGSAVVLPTPASEFQANPLYQGCENHEA